MKRLVFFTILLFICRNILAQAEISQPNPPLLDNVHTATAITLNRGDYVTSFWAYHNGGLLTKAQLGVHDNIYLGVSFDVENVIGRDEVRFNIPGVIAKVKFTDGPASFPILLAIGYDSFSTGSMGKLPNGQNPWNRVLYGPYFALTKPIYLFGEEQYFHAGVRMPVQPYYLPEDSSAYFAFTFPVGYFTPIFEIERIFFNHRRMDEISYNLGFRLTFIPNLALEVDILSQYRQRASRMVVLEYQSRF